MRRLTRFVRLPRADQLLLLRSIFLVGTVRIGLWLLPFRVVRSIVVKSPIRPGVVRPRSRLVWSITTASRYLPGSTCLTQALAGQVLLAQSGYQSKVEIGVAKSDQRFEAHAWLVSADHVVLGGPSVDRYTSLLAWEGRQQLLKAFPGGDAVP